MRVTQKAGNRKAGLSATDLTIGLYKTGQTCGSRHGEPFRWNSGLGQGVAEAGGCYWMMILIAAPHTNAEDYAPRRVAAWVKLKRPLRQPKQYNITYLKMCKAIFCFSLKYRQPLVARCFSAASPIGASALECRKHSRRKAHIPCRCARMGLSVFSTARRKPARRPSSTFPPAGTFIRNP